MDKVSIIVPVFNRKNLIIRCLDSIKCQTWLPIELIVVDNGSDDGSHECVAEWASHNDGDEFKVVVVREWRKGACAARNRGLNMATGKYCLFFDSDDSMHPDLVENAMKEFKRHQECEIVCWRSAIHQLNGKVRIPPFYTDDPFECHMIHTLLRTHGYMATTALFRDVGGWNESLSCWNDLELGIRMLIGICVRGRGESTSMTDGFRRADRKVCGIQSVLTDIYAQSESITGRDFSSRCGEWEKALDAVRINIRKTDLPFKRRLLQMVDYKEMILAAGYRSEGNNDVSSRLMDKINQSGSLNVFQKILFRLLFIYTSHGGRGGWKVARLSFAAAH